MDGDLDGKGAQGAAGEGHEGEQTLAQGHQDAQADGADDSAADYQAALKAKDAHIAELQGKVNVRGTRYRLSEVHAGRSSIAWREERR